MMDTSYMPVHCTVRVEVSIRSVGLVCCVIRGTRVRFLSGLQRVLVEWLHRWRWASLVYLWE